MNDELSIRPLTLEHSKRCALIVGDNSYSYGELAELISATTLPAHNIHHAAHPQQTALAFYASLEKRRCIALLAHAPSQSELTQIAHAVSQTQNEPALILFTSGSSGPPKGVKLSRRALLASAKASAQTLGWSGNDRWLCVLPMSHIGGLSILTRCLVARKTAVLWHGFDAEGVAHEIFRQKITHISLVPTMLWRLLETGFRAPEHLAVTLMGGASMTPELISRAQNAGFRLKISYGLTESGSQIITGGAPLPGVECRLRDCRLEIKGPMLMDGYLPPHDQPPSVVSGWFLTSDLAKIHADGSVQILGRSDDIIISGGENIDPREVERALIAGSEIHAAYAFALPHEEWGQELVALIECNPLLKFPIPGDLHTKLQGHRKPKALIPVATIPLLDNGKVDHQEALAIAKRWRRSRAE